MEKVEKSLSSDDSGQSNTTEEIFRCIQTLQSLLENPPGDFPDNLQEDIVKGFVGIFSYARKDGKISRKLIECINTYLLKDGPNLGRQSLEIHYAVQQFVFHCWSTVQDRGVKDSLILYARLQLNLTRGAADGSDLLEQLLDVIGKELDQIHTSSTAALRSGTTRENKYGNLTTSQRGLVELAALVIYRACVNTSKAPVAGKRVKRVHAAVRLKDGLMKGKWLWNAAVCYIVSNYHTHISKDLFISWFEGICLNFERIINDATKEHAYDGLLWTLRSLQGLSSVLLPPASEESSSSLSFTTSEVEKGWHTIWSCLMRGLPMFSNVTTVADAALMLLGSIISSDLLHTFTVSQDVWDLRLFKSFPSMSLLCFISCYFSRRGSQGDLRDSLHLRQNLLRTVLSLLSSKDISMFNERMVVLLPAAIFALCAGSSSFPHCERELSASNFFVDILVVTEKWATVEEHEQASSYELFTCSPEVLAEINTGSGAEVCQAQQYHSVRLPGQLRDPLLHEMEDCVLEAVVNERIEKMLLSDIIFKSALLSNFMYSSSIIRLREEVSPFLFKISCYMLDLLQRAVSIIEEHHSDIRVF